VSLDNAFVLIDGTRKNEAFTWVEWNGVPPGFTIFSWTRIVLIAPPIQFLFTVILA
jgi:hypothetical protein